MPPGQPVMNIVSSKKVFVVDARVMPMDIDVVHAGPLNPNPPLGPQAAHACGINGEVTHLARCFD